MIDAALLLPKLLTRAGENADLTEIAAQIAWRRAAGEGLRHHAVPTRLREKTLIVSVADAVWQKQLQTMSAELIFRVNKLLQKNVVSKIEFRIDPRTLRQGTPQNRSVTPVAAPLPSNVVSSAADIHDDDLRARFIRAVANCISRRDYVQSEIHSPQSAI